MTAVLSQEAMLRPTAPHDHVWQLRETEYDEHGMTVNRFECVCGQVVYS